MELFASLLLTSGDLEANRARLQGKRGHVVLRWAALYAADTVPGVKEGNGFLGGMLEAVPEWEQWVSFLLSPVFDPEYLPTSVAIYLGIKRKPPPGYSDSPGV